jgi:hypothetical protein
MIEVEWNDDGKSGDDFTAKTEDGYMLRAEDMGDHWWWQVYTPKGESLNPHCDLNATYEYAAKGMAVLVYRLHSNNHTTNG